MRRAQSQRPRYPAVEHEASSNEGFMNDPNVQRASHLDTATLSDAMDKLGIAGQCLGIKPRDH